MPRTRKRPIQMAGVALALLVIGALVVGVPGCWGRQDQTPSRPSPVITPSTEPTSTEPTATAPTAEPDVPIVVVPTPEPAPAPTPAPTPKPTPTPTPTQPAPTDNTRRGWWYTPNTSHKVPTVASGAADLLAKYAGRYVGPSASCVYLTFDEGYENGYTGQILDTLAAKQAKAVFFVTESYIDKNPALVKRMVSEGHVVANHSATHPSMVSLATDPTTFNRELTDTAAAYHELTGKTMAKLFRPPKGDWSPLSLWRTKQLGYTSVFWSFAHRDWVTTDQPTAATTLDRILTGSHPGAIYLLHAVSQSNTQALPDAIDGLRAQGYTLGVLGR